jgi:aminoglycoside 2'-N-acetyltransferase I
MPHPLMLEVVPAEELAPATRAEIIDLCTRAYAERFDHLFESLPGSVHVLARLGNPGGELVSHAAWVVRWLQPEQCLSLRTAYVEAVATAPEYQRRGFATAVMKQVGASIAQRGYDLGALSPSNAEFYLPFGWELWRGPLAIRTPNGLVPTPGEQVMVLRLPRTPPTLDLDVRLTAEWRIGELW